LLATLLGVGTAFWLTGPWRERKDRESKEVDRQQPAAGGPGVAASRAPRIRSGSPAEPGGPKKGATAAPWPEGLERLEGQPGPGAYLERYGGRSGALPPGARPRPAEPVTEISSPQKDPELVVWVPSVRVDPTGTTIFARLEGPGREPVPDATLQVAVAPAEAVTLPPFQSMGPAARGSGAHFAFSFRPPPVPASGTGVLTRPPRGFRYLVRARGQLDGQPFVRTAGGLFHVHQPGARIVAGSVHVAPAGDDLGMRMEVTIDRPGTYWAYAELWGGPDGAQAIAFARERLERMPAGRHSLELRFGGAILRDREIPGPYVVRNLRLKQVDTHPPHEASPISELPPTPRFPHHHFSLTGPEIQVVAAAARRRDQARGRIG